MRNARSAALGLVVLGAATGVWIAGGRFLASRRERDAARAFETAFGPRAALEAKYAVASTNATATRVEELARGMGFDLALHERRASAGGRGGSGDERAAVRNYVEAQLVRGGAALDAATPEVAAALSSRRVALSALEELLVAGAAPRWECDSHARYEDKPVPSGIGHLLVQRLLVADALAKAAGGDHVGAASALEASWQLNRALSSRPEVVSQMIACAVGRYEAGALRKVEVPAGVWNARLAAMGRRDPFVDALVLEHAGDNSEGWIRAIAGLRAAPAFEAPKKDEENPRRASEILLAIALPNIRESFVRADRLALDAELTMKILRIKAIRRARGAWPDPSAEIAASRFPGLSWDYRLSGDGVTIAIGREIPVLGSKNSFVLPLSFTATAGSP